MPPSSLLLVGNITMNSDENSIRVPETARVNCYGCKHFFITWDKEFPYGCRRMEFRSKRLPSEDVIEADGQRCLAREEASLEQSPGKKAVNGRTDTQNRPKNSETRAGKAKPRVGGSLNLKV